MSAELPPEALARLARSYRALRECDSALNARTKKQLQAIETRALKLREALSAQEVSGFFYDQDEIVTRLGHVAYEAQRIHKQDFRNFNRNSAGRYVALELCRLFECHGLPFMATAANNDYENSINSNAVEAFLKVAELADDHDMNADTARKWIESVIREWQFTKPRKKLRKQSTEKRAKVSL